jgi:hypothetical protein
MVPVMSCCADVSMDQHSSPSTNLAQLLQETSSIERPLSVKASLDGSSYCSLLQSKFRKITVAFTEESAARAAAVSTALALKATAADSEEFAISALGELVSFLSYKEAERSSTSRICFTTTDVLSFQMMFSRPKHPYDGILLCNTDHLDSHCSLVLKSAFENKIPVACVVCDDKSKERHLEKVLAAETFANDLLPMIMQRHKASCESLGNTVVFMIDDDVFKFSNEHKRELNKHFSVITILPESTISQIIQLAEACRAGGVLIFASVFCVHECSILPKVELVIDTCVNAQLRTYDGVSCVIPVVPSPDLFLSEAINRSSFAKYYIRAREFEAQLLSYTDSCQLYSAVVASEIVRVGRIGHRLAGTIAAMIHECGVISMAECDVGANALPTRDSFSAFDGHNVAAPLPSKQSLLASIKALFLNGIPAVKLFHWLQHCANHGVLLESGIRAPLGSIMTLGDLMHGFIQNQGPQHCILNDDERLKVISTLIAHKHSTLEQLGLVNSAAGMAATRYRASDDAFGLHSCIGVALSVLAHVSSETLKSETSERRHLRQLAMSAMQTAGLVHEAFQNSSQQKVAQMFHLHLSTLPSLSFVAMQCIVPRELPWESIDLAHQNSEDAYVIRALAHGVSTSTLKTFPRLDTAMSRLQSLAAVDDHGITDQGRILALIPLSPFLGAFILRCSEFNLTNEGLIAAVAIQTSGSFWNPEIREMHRGCRDELLNAAIVSVVEEIRLSNCVSEESAMNAAKLGRIIVKYAPHLREAVKDELRREPGLVFVGQRANQRVYFNESLALTSTVSPRPKNQASAFQNRRDFTSCVAIIMSCIQQIIAGHLQKIPAGNIVKQCSDIYGVQRRTLSSILKQVCSLMSLLNLIDLSKYSMSPNFVSFLDALQRHSSVCGRLYPSLSEWSSDALLQRRELFESAVIQHFRISIVECFSVATTGEVKTAMLRSDGAFRNVLTPFVCHQQEPACFTSRCVKMSSEQGIAFASLCVLVNEPVATGTAIVPVPAAIVNVMIKHGSFPVHPACFISIRSSQELSLFGPLDALRAAEVEVRSMIKSIAKQLISVPCVVPANSETISFGHRISLGAGLVVQSVLPPTESNILILANIPAFLGIKREIQLSLHEMEIELMCAMKAKLQSSASLVPLPLELFFDSNFVASQSLYDAIDDKKSPAARSAKLNIPSPKAHFIFNNANDARIAYQVLEVNFSGFVHLPVEIGHVSRPTQCAFRVTFALSHFKHVPCDSDDAVELQNPVTFCGQKLFPVDAVCRNRSEWHVGHCHTRQFTSAICCTHHVKRLPASAIHNSDVPIGSFRHSGQIIEYKGAAPSESRQPLSLTCWSCCGQPSCDIFESEGRNDLKCSVACRSAYSEYSKRCQVANAKAFRFCWERYYFSSAEEQREASRHPLAQEFQRKHNSKQGSERDDTKQSTTKPSKYDSPDSRLYSLVFVDAASKWDACGGGNRMIADRRVPFQFGRHLLVSL